MSPSARLLVAAPIGILVVYVCVYLALSIGGRYEPDCIGLNGVKWYAWAPRGFVSDWRWNRAPRLIFLPLYWLDQRFWHTWDAQHSGAYPIHQPTDIGEVYRAWDDR